MAILDVVDLKTCFPPLTPMEVPTNFRFPKSPNIRDALYGPTGFFACRTFSARIASNGTTLLKLAQTIPCGCRDFRHDA